MSKFVPCVRVSLRNFTGEAIDFDVVQVKDPDDLSNRERADVQYVIRCLSANISVGDTITVEEGETEVN